MFLNAQALIEQVDTADIGAYEDFKNSRGVIIVFVVDCIYVDIYAKRSDERSAKRAIRGGPLPRTP